MTDSDLRDAREAVDERIESTRRRRRVLMAGAAAAVLVPILGIVAFQTLGEDDKTVQPVDEPAQDPLQTFLSGADPDPQRTAGLWRLDNDTRLVLFGEDGTVRFEGGGQIYSHPNATGTYELDGDRITVTIVESVQSECAGKTIPLRGSHPAPGLMHVALGGASAGSCSLIQTYERWVLEHMLTTDDESIDFGPDGTETWQPVKDPSILRGDWVAVGGGHVLEMTPEGTYVVASGAGEVVDRGQWNLSEERQLRLVSGGDSPSCTAGDQLVLNRLAHADPGTLLLRGTMAQNTCGGAWTPAVWFLLPQGDS